MWKRRQSFTFDSWGMYSTLGHTFPAFRKKIIGSYRVSAVYLGRGGVGQWSLWSAIAVQTFVFLLEKSHLLFKTLDGEIW